ncbi:recombinase family protein [Propionibacterium cyclohexanicum]|uniref:recombinase family protein n=1 Tax=Propionibacterium cyclohexanicum TaxID=64702 RepID=UPI001FDEAD9E|nr:recombinase family protein [Propionibacterium cyclohexanicum]
MTPDSRGENYITHRPLSDSQEPALTRQKGLDFEGKESVNPEDVTGGTPMNPATQETTITREPTLTSITGLEHLLKDNGESERATRTGAAVVYLRVSTTRQMNTAADLDEDGNSIATQREWTLKKAKELRVPVLREFVEPGQSAQTIEKRPEFKKLLRFIDSYPDVKYVVIYMRSRVFRNHLDAAIVKRSLREKGVELISAKENFGDGYMGDAMEAITDVVNELQVRMSGEDIKIKMAHKVERGGTVGRAKLGYLNARKDFDGRLVNTIDVDPVRAPLIRWAFEQYSTGQHSIMQLQMMLEDQGLTTRPSSKRAARPLSTSQLAMILRDPYYTGVIRYKGRLYPGRHEPIISKELFLAVQKILDGRNRRGDRDRTHFHFLRGLLYCAECKEAGRDSRLVYSQNTGRGGTYEYYLCTAKQRGLCTMPSVRLDAVEDAVARAVAAEEFRTEELVEIRDQVRHALEEMQSHEQEEKDALRKQLDKLEAQEDRLIDLAADGKLPSSKLRERLEAVTLQKGAVAEKLARTGARIQRGVDRVYASVDLLEKPRELYESLPDSARRNLLGAFFKRLNVLVAEDGLHLTSERTEINETFHEWQTHHRFAARAHAATKRTAPRESAGSRPDSQNRLTQSKGLNKTVLVGLTGFEPATP